MTTHYPYSELSNQPELHEPQTPIAPAQCARLEASTADFQEEPEPGSSEESIADSQDEPRPDNVAVLPVSTDSPSPPTPVPPSEPSQAPFDPESNERKPKGTTKRTRRFGFACSWCWELGSAILSVLCVALLIAFLKVVDGTPYNNWQYRISPNAVAAVIVTIARSAMLISVSSCLSQLKWNQCQPPKPTPLYHIELLDQASRGPWGALELFWRLRPGLATIGAALTILSVALDPFAQQILVFPSRQVRALNETAYTQSTHGYSPLWSTQPSGNTGIIATTEVEPTMQVAIMSGLSQIYSPLEPTCSTGTCYYPRFVSLGICSECEDVTEKAKQTCVPSETWKSLGVLYGLNLHHSPLNCTYTSPAGYNLTPSFVGFPAQYQSGISFNRQPWTSIATTEATSKYTLTKIVSFFAAKYERPLIYTPQNITAPEQRPIMTECSVSWCEREYARNYISPPHRYLETTRSQNLYVGFPSSEGTFLTPRDGHKTLSENSTYVVDYMAVENLSAMMSNLFQSTLLEADGPFTGHFSGIQSALILWSSKNLTQSVAEMALSLTDKIRTGNKVTRISGTAYTNRTYIHVRWPWIILLILSVVLSAVLLGATVISSRSLHAVVWKSSVLPLLVGRLAMNPEHDLGRLDDLDEMIDMSKKVGVVMEGQSPPVLVEC